MTRRLVVSVHDLRSTDVLALKVFLRFVGKSADFAWELSDQDDGDLRLVAWDEQTWPDMLDDPQAAPVVPVVDDARNSPWQGGLCLQRPLQMEVFADLLRMCEARAASAATRTSTQQVGSASEPAPAPHLPPQVPAPSAASAASSVAGAAAAAPARPPGPRRTPAAARASVAAVPAGVASAEVLPIPPEFVGVSFRLLRWPTAGQMRGRPSLTRVLGFLAHRPMSLEQLVLHSGLAVGQCGELLAFLESCQLVERLGSAPAAQALPAQQPAVRAGLATAPTQPVEAAGPAAPASPGSARPAAPTRIAGLLSRLRLHLGI